jgi:acyl carrier protein
MNKEEILDKIRHIFSNVLKIEFEKINHELSKDNTDQWDSLTHLILIMNIEEKMSVKFDIETIGELKSVKRILEELNKELNNE